MAGAPAAAARPPPPPPPPPPAAAPSRRAALALPPLLALAPRAARAALLQFPVRHLRNDYWLVRAGESAALAAGRVLANPVAKTSMASALSPRGARQVADELYPFLRDAGALADGAWLWASMHAAAYQTGEVLAERAGLGRSRLVPEFSKLDARGVGTLEGGDPAAVAAALAAGEAGSAAWRPPRGADGTPDESLADVAVRLRELLSLTETQYGGATVLLIAPDADNLSVLQAAVLGADLRAHRRWALDPGRAARLRVEAGADPADAAPRGVPCPNPPSCAPREAPPEAPAL